jgi:ABC-type antimicrobial peptide transport system permease subunit
MLKKQLLFSLRRLARHKLNTTINVLGLTLGILSCLVIFLFVSFEFSYDKFHPDGDRIYRLVGGFPGMTPPLGTDLRRESSGFGTVASFYIDDSKVIVSTATGKATRAFDEKGPGELSHMAYAGPEYFTLFPHRWLAGNPQTSLSKPFSVVLTEKEARRYFDGGDPQSWMGRTLVYHDSLTLSVTGIVADWKANSDVALTDWISYSTIQSSFVKNDMAGWNMWDGSAQVYVKLPKGASPAQSEKQLPAFVARHSLQPVKEQPKLTLQPLADLHFNGQMGDDYGRRAHKPTLYALCGIALFILLIATINFINLSTAQAVQRAREIGVRKVLGSSRLGLTGQFLIETGVLVIASLILALLLANPVIHALNGFIPAGVHLDLTNPLTLGFIALTAISTCLLAGWYPARVISAFLPVISLRGQGSQPGGGRSYLRKALITFQFTVSLLFIIATLVVGRQMHYMLDTHLGFTKDAILNIDLPWNKPREKKSVLATEISRLAGVQKVSLNSNNPGADGHNGTFMTLKGATETKIDGAGCDIVDANYLPLYEIKLVAGRNFTLADTARNGVETTSAAPIAKTPGSQPTEKTWLVPPFRAFIINESAAIALGFKNPADAVGQRIATGFGGTIGPVVGVMKDYHAESFRSAIKPFFLTTQKGGGGTLSVRLGSSYRTPEQVKGLLAKMQATFSSVYPESKFSTRFFDEVMNDLYQKEQKTARIMNLAMAMAIFISCMGLFGLAAFTASQRTKEIGIRKVLGANVPHLVSLLSRDFVVLVLLATVIAAPIAGWAMSQWLQDFAYRTDIPWYIYAISGLGAVVIALITVSFQAIRAATANPVESLRSE